MIRILIVEDQPVQREQLIRIFRQNCFEVFAASNGLEGVERANSCQPDLILTDLRMPRMDGIEAIKMLRSSPLTANTPIIVVTAWHNKRIKAKAYAAGASLYFTKPVDEFRLVREANKLVASTGEHSTLQAKRTPLR